MTTITETKKRIMKDAALVRVQTVLGTAVKITKQDACRMLNILESRSIKPSIEFTEMRPGKYLVTIDS